MLLARMAPRLHALAPLNSYARVRTAIPDLPGRIAHQKVASKGRDDQSVEGVNHDCRVASGKLDLNQ